VFETIVHGCITEGLIKGEGFATDASIIKADANRLRFVSGGEAKDQLDTEQATRPVQEYLDALDKENISGAIPKKISPTDPQGRFTGATGRPAFYAYSTNYLIDIEHNIVVDEEATSAYRTAEVESTKIMMDRVDKRFNLKPERLIGDTAYGTAPMLEWMVKKKRSNRMFRFGINLTKSQMYSAGLISYGMPSGLLPLSCRKTVAIQTTEF